MDTCKENTKMAALFPVWLFICSQSVYLLIPSIVVLLLCFVVIFWVTKVH